MNSAKSLPKGKPEKQRSQQHQKRLEINERLFRDSVKEAVVRQVQQTTDIATIQDQVTAMLHDDDEAELSAMPYFSLKTGLGSETRSLLCLLIFLLLEVLLQLAFSGHLAHLVPYLPEAIHRHLG